MSISICDMNFGLNFMEVNRFKDSYQVINGLKAVKELAESCQYCVLSLINTRNFNIYSNMKGCICSITVRGNLK